MSSYWWTIVVLQWAYQCPFVEDFDTCEANNKNVTFRVTFVSLLSCKLWFSDGYSQNNPLLYLTLFDHMCLFIKNYVHFILQLIVPFITIFLFEFYHNKQTSRYIQTNNLFKINKNLFFFNQLFVYLKLLGLNFKYNEKMLRVCTEKFRNAYSSDVVIRFSLIPIHVLNNILFMYKVNVFVIIISSSSLMKVWAHSYFFNTLKIDKQ